jgi:hypothetical protein
MKKIIKNYIIRDPEDVVFTSGSNYQSIDFNPSLNKQTIFDRVIPLGMTIKPNKTELYVNGIRYNIEIDYIIEGGNIKWINDTPLEPSDNLTFIYR